MPGTSVTKPLLLAAALASVPLAGAGAVSAARAVLAKAPRPSAPDTLIPPHVPYKGYRLHVRDVQLLRQRRDRYLVSVRVVNTGSRAVGLGPGFPVHFLQTDFDDALAQSGLLPLAPGIRRALVDEALALEVAGEVDELEFWVTPAAPAAAPVARTDDIAPTYRRRLPKKPARAREPDAESADRGEGERLYASAKPVTPPSDPVPPSDPATASDPAPAASLAEDEPCADLRVGAVEVLQRDRRSALVELAIVNDGRHALTREALGTGATLDVYLGGSEQVTAASERLARVNLSSRIGSSLGKGLQPGATITVTERLDLSSLTRYTRVLVAQLDPGQVVAECDETNNETSVVLKR